MAANETSRQVPALPDQLFEDAAVWFTRLRDPEATDELRAEFARWLAADPIHARAYTETEELWGALEAPVNRVLADQAVVRLVPRALRRVPPVWRWVALAACLVLMLGTSLCWREGFIDDLRSDYVTATGAQRTVTLADGSAVELNTDSALAVAFEPKRRVVRLFRGEAWFKVSHDAARPFIVETAEGRVQVTGTQFNVRIVGDQAVVSLVEGTVALISAEPRGGRLDLTASQQAVLTGTGIDAPTAFDPASVTAWQHGQLVFYRTPLEQVVAQLNRYHTGRIIVLNPKLRKLQVTGVFDVSDSASALAVIQNTLHAEIYRLTDYLILLQ